MGIKLSAVGISELKSVNEADQVPFDLIDEPTVSENEKPRDRVSTSTAPTKPTNTAMRSAMEQLIKAQAAFTAGLMELMAAILEATEGGQLTGPPDARPIAVAPSLSYSPDLLGKPWDNLQVADTRLGFPAGCVKVLTEAGVVSVASLAERIESGELIRLPKVGKAKAAVITETFRAFQRAVEDHQKDQS